MPLRPCLGDDRGRCGTLTDRADSRCPTHASQRNRVRDQARGSRQQRGYDAVHDRLRARLAPDVEAELIDCQAVVCLLPTRRILPAQPWQLGHTADRTTWTGPEHRACNEAAGGRAAHVG
jgi:hypothetical protein